MLLYPSGDSFVTNHSFRLYGVAQVAHCSPTSVISSLLFQSNEEVTLRSSTISDIVISAQKHCLEINSFSLSTCTFELNLSFGLRQEIYILLTTNECKCKSKF